MTEKTFLLSMIAAYPCHLNKKDHFGTGFCNGNGLCEGDLNDRPEWCPLVPVNEPINGMVPANKKVWVEE